MRILKMCLDLDAIPSADDYGSTAAAQIATPTSATPSTPKFSVQTSALEAEASDRASGRPPSLQPLRVDSAVVLKCCHISRVFGLLPRILSPIGRARDKSSCRDIDVLGLAENLIAKIPAEECRRVEVDSSAQHLR